MKLNTKSLTEVEIGFLVVTPGIYHARIEKSEVKANKAGTGHNLYLMFKVLDPEVTLNKDGSIVKNKGNIIASRYIALTPADNYDPDQKIKELALAIGHDMTQDFQESDALNKIVNIKLSYKAAEGQYQEGNDVDRITAIKPDDTFTEPMF